MYYDIEDINNTGTLLLESFGETKNPYIIFSCSHLIASPPPPDSILSHMNSLKPIFMKLDMH